jgi:hypothetical protein
VSLADHVCKVWVHFIREIAWLGGHDATGADDERATWGGIR